MIDWRLNNGISAFLFIAGYVIFSVSNALALDCTCRNIGTAFCIPDPVCFEKAIKDKIKSAIEKGSQNTGKSFEKAVQEISEAVEKAQSSTKLIILETGYSQLPELGKEEPGYGLYSYVILSSNSDRSSALLDEVFKSVPAIDDTAAQRPQINILYIPIKKDKSNDFASAVMSLRGDTKKLGTEYADSFYDYKIARGLLNHVCNPPSDTMRELCAGDMSRGPYIFTYGRVASTLEPVPPPFLFVDLSDVDPRAFAEFVSAFKAQIKRDDVSDGARINSMRLRILNVLLKASDWISPVQKAIAGIVKSTGENNPTSK